MTTFISTETIPLLEYRSKWERIWPKDGIETITLSKKEPPRQDSFVRSRVQRYSINDSKNLSKQTGFVNTVNTSKITVQNEKIKEEDQVFVWVLHNAVPRVKTENVVENGVYTSTIYYEKIRE